MDWVDESDGELTQGGILDLGDDSPLHIILSNACDLEHGKCSFIVLAALVPAVEVIKANKEYSEISNGELSGKQGKRLRKLVERFVYNKDVSRYYFIDPSAVLDSEALFVDFQNIKSVRISEATEGEVVAKLRSPLVEQMMMHFVSYVARIPSDRADDDYISRLIDRLGVGV